MSITIHIHYTGKNGAAQAFAREMSSTGVVDRIRAEPGNQTYAYYLPLDDPETILLIDSWQDQAALDLHPASPMMAEIVALRQKYGLTMRVERFLPDQDGIPASDQAFIVKERSQSHAGN